MTPLALLQYVVTSNYLIPVAAFQIVSVTLYFQDKSLTLILRVTVRVLVLKPVHFKVIRIMEMITYS